MIIVKEKNKKNIQEAVDIKKIVKDLQGNFGGSNEEQLAGVQLLKGLATSDEKIANEFMKKLDTETTKISKEILGNKKEEDKARLQIRSHTYRGEEGFLVVGKSARGGSISIFTPDRDRAEKIKQAYYSGEEWKVSSILAPDLFIDQKDFILKSDTRIGDQILEKGEQIKIIKKNKKQEEIQGSSTHLEAILKKFFKPFGLKVKWTIDSIEIVMPNEDWYWHEFSASGKLEEFNSIVRQFNVDYDIVDDTIIIFI